jgi:hypothetical protein
MPEEWLKEAFAFAGEQVEGLGREEVQQGEGVREGWETAESAEGGDIRIYAGKQDKWKPPTLRSPTELPRIQKELHEDPRTEDEKLQDGRR